MDKDKESITSRGVSMLRAVHQLSDPGPKILDDTVILRLLPEDLIRHIRENAVRYAHPAARALRAHVLLRSRYAEDCLSEAFRRGVRQYIILGAGLDTFPYRQPEWAHELRIFELDHPATQADKRGLLENAGIAVPENLGFVSVNLETGDLRAALRASAFDPARPAFISWLGVMPYLTPAANDRIFRFAADLPASSELVFTFSQKDRPGEPHPLALRAAELGEPWLTRVDLPELEAQLSHYGFSKISFLDPLAAARRYFADPETDIPGPRRVNIARVAV
ncbi:class I SAM-dependent methyltransferase [Compostibacter hankyongensis]|uniref:S-adenosyl-L-methionine-dependent methyltransferase n=1 Tax=Compostibacter hankyongensis TaxID=1007089 RepID=A0ABP8FS16_9BACT